MDPTEQTTSEPIDRAKKEAQDSNDNLVLRRKRRNRNMLLLLSTIAIVWAVRRLREEDKGDHEAKEDKSSNESVSESKSQTLKEQIVTLGRMIGLGWGSESIAANDRVQMEGYAHVPPAGTSGRSGSQNDHREWESGNTRNGFGGGQSGSAGGGAEESNDQDSESSGGEQHKSKKGRSGEGNAEDSKQEGKQESAGADGRGFKAQEEEKADDKPKEEPKTESFGKDDKKEERPSDSQHEEPNQSEPERAYSKDDTDPSFKTNYTNTDEQECEEPEYVYVRRRRPPDQQFKKKILEWMEYLFHNRVLGRQPVTPIEPEQAPPEELMDPKPQSLTHLLALMTLPPPKSHPLRRPGRKTNRQTGMKVAPNISNQNLTSEANRTLLRTASHAVQITTYVVSVAAGVGVGLMILGGVIGKWLWGRQAEPQAKPDEDGHQPPHDPPAPPGNQHPAPLAETRSESALSVESVTAQVHLQAPGASSVRLQVAPSPGMPVEISPDEPGGVGAAERAPSAVVINIASSRATSDPRSSRSDIGHPAGEVADLRAQLEAARAEIATVTQDRDRLAGLLQVSETERADAIASAAARDQQLVEQRAATKTATIEADAQRVRAEAAEAKLQLLEAAAIEAAAVMDRDMALQKQRVINAEADAAIQKARADRAERSKAPKPQLVDAATDPVEAEIVRREESREIRVQRERAEQIAKELDSMRESLEKLEVEIQRLKVANARLEERLNAERQRAEIAEEEAKKGDGLVVEVQRDPADVRAEIGSLRQTISELSLKHERGQEYIQRLLVECKRLYALQVKVQRLVDEGKLAEASEILESGDPGSARSVLDSARAVIEEFDPAASAAPQPAGAVSEPLESGRSEVRVSYSAPIVPVPSEPKASQESPAAVLASLASPVSAVVVRSSNGNSSEPVLVSGANGTPISMSRLPIGGKPSASGIAARAAVQVAVSAETVVVRPVVRVPGDGSCVLHAIANVCSRLGTSELVPDREREAYGVLPTGTQRLKELSIRKVRAEIAEYLDRLNNGDIRNEREQSIWTKLDACLRQKGISFAVYLSAILGEGQLGEIELDVISALHRLKITVYGGPDRTQIHSVGTDDMEPVELLYTQGSVDGLDHYDAIAPAAIRAGGPIEHCDAIIPWHVSIMNAAEDIMKQAAGFGFFCGHFIKEGMNKLGNIAVDTINNPVLLDAVLWGFDDVIDSHFTNFVGFGRHSGKPDGDDLDGSGVSAAAAVVSDNPPGALLVGNVSAIVGATSEQTQPQ